MKQVTEAPFRPIKPENSAGHTHTADTTGDAGMRDAFEYTREEILSITNYLEALYARIQRATHGCGNLSLVTDDAPTGDCPVFSSSAPSPGSALAGTPKK
ncbi:hypothetical protein [Rhizobium hainanense]|uniref:hypothetical protein n=1 Tax=Rhizobium hainanense TaxID=52131 RepID=UPI001179909C|nr:hypothetical protein [Rhizobium hainanense]